jgi:hypothetical protein
LPRAADAIADHVDLFFSRLLLDRFDRGERTFMHVALEGFRRQFCIGINPGDDKHGESPIDAPLDEGVLRREIENVKFIDPGRDDQQGAFEHRRRCRLVLDELNEIVLKNHFARRNRQVAAESELAQIGLPNLKVTLPGFNVLAEHVHPTHEIFGIG